MAGGLSIGFLARRAGMREANIRYYEEIGLLPAADRRGNGHRVYGVADLQRLIFVKNCRALGFAIDDVREFLTLMAARDKSCAGARDLAGKQLAAVRAKLAELRRLEKTLLGQIESCASACPDGAMQDCVMISGLQVPQA